MKDIITAAGIYKLITIICIIIISIYVFKEKNKWTKFSQGTKPLLPGILIGIASIIINGMSENQWSVRQILLFLTFHSFGTLSLLRMILVAYILVILGVEISLVVFIKKRKEKLNL
jgi:hypothetical protein